MSDKNGIEIQHLGPMNTPFFVKKATGEILSDDEFMTRKRFLRVDEVGSILRVSTRMVYKLVEQGKLSGLRVGEALRIRTQSLYDYLKDTSNEIYEAIQ